MNQSSCAKCGAVVVDSARHEEWHQYHQQQLVRMVHQIDRQAKVTGGLIMRFSSFVNKGGSDEDGDSGITVDLLAFATYWIGAGMAIGVLAWSVSERRWLPAGAMLLFALGAMYLAYREIRPAGRSEPRHAAGHADVDVREPRSEPTPDPAYSPPPQARQHQYQPQEPAPQRQAQSTATQPVPAQPRPQYESQYGEATWGTPNGRTPPIRRNDGWR